jgi:mRNA-degrading endonuclease HigB of HigAB toxin-antitoxin module
MRIIASKRLRQYAKDHPDAKAALLYLEALFENATWRNINEVRRYRKDADLVPVKSGRVLQVFNVRENYYRLIVHIHFDRQQIYIRDFLTHKEYASGKWKERH